MLVVCVVLSAGYARDRFGRLDPLAPQFVGSLTSLLTLWELEFGARSFLQNSIKLCGAALERAPLPALPPSAACGGMRGCAAVLGAYSTGRTTKI